MTTSSEDVLLQIGSVKYKKGDGTLYIMNERIAWMAENRDTVTVSHRYADIKMQKISPEGKPKIQLQLVLNDGSSSTFHFVNREGTQAQLNDRERVKDRLFQLLPNFRKKVNKELEEKNRLLSEHPVLLQLYKDLVIPQVLSSEEFWTMHAAQYTKDRDTVKQDIGVSGAFLADIKPQTDGCNGLKYNLTSDVIACVFKTFPAVKKKHMENVPSKMSESEFWTKFFQSHYFHRDRLMSGTKDIFTECGKIDDNAQKQAISACRDPLLQLSQFEDKTLEEGFGGITTGAELEGSKRETGNIVHQNMIHRFNLHSTMVLNSSKEQDESVNNNQVNGTAKTSLPMTNGNGPLGNNTGLKHSNTNCDNSEPSNKKARIIEKITYDDLSKDPDENKRTATLNLTKVDRYLHGPVPLNPSDTAGCASTSSGASLDVESSSDVTQQLQQQCSTWSSRLPQRMLVNPTAAVSALGELSPGGALMRGFQEQSLAQLVPPDLEKEIRQLYLSASELLKHFWKSFPPTTPQLEAKALRMHEALDRFRMARLKPFEDKVHRELSPLGKVLTRHLNTMLMAASRKLMAWQERKHRQMQR
ncbi:general transcription factor IIH subunit 1 [Ctenocephalides felis]|uniref:general transcription factor IIH subunit 1 n=1 Tax=Ctenocephalides felis TaxID=7515 RepID=UPI000E6E16D6|nr:general transcription factor IIH subunit 1 [Ctenocephalides felis]